MSQRLAFCIIGRDRSTREKISTYDGTTLEFYQYTKDGSDIHRFPTASGSQSCALFEICGYQSPDIHRFPTASGSQSCALFEICGYQSHP